MCVCVRSFEFAAAVFARISVCDCSFLLLLVFRAFDVCINLPLAAAATVALLLLFYALCIYILFLLLVALIFTFGVLAVATTFTHSYCAHTSLALPTPLSPFLLLV